MVLVVVMVLVVLLYLWYSCTRGTPVLVVLLYLWYFVHLVLVHLIEKSVVSRFTRCWCKIFQLEKVPVSKKNGAGFEKGEINLFITLRQSE